MPASLMETFDAVYVLDLHSDIYETPPEGVRDENVFDITKGVAIGIFVKRPSVSTGLAAVHYAEAWGPREEKYRLLNSHDVTDTPWTELPDVDRATCLGDFSFFVPKAFDDVDEYCRGWSIDDMFRVSGVGLETQRDKVAVRFEEGEMRYVIESISNTPVEQFRDSFDVGPDGRDWTLSAAVADVASGDGVLTQFGNGPFDQRWTWYSGKVKGFQAYPRHEIHRHLLSGDNPALIAPRQSIRESHAHFFITRGPVARNFLDSAGVLGSGSVFPLYLYPEANPTDLFAAAQTGREPNLSPAFVAALTEATGWSFVPEGVGTLAEAGGTVGPEAVLAYAYAVFHSPAFRSRYAAFLRIDFPRLPLTTDRALFRSLVGHGERLVALHLLPGFPRRGGRCSSSAGRRP